MTRIAEFALPTSEFPLGVAFEVRPDATLELDRVVPNEDTVMPYFWVYDPESDLDAFARAFADLPELRSVTLMEDLGDRGLFRAEWNPEYLGIMRAIATSDLTVVSATGSLDGWRFELRAQSADQLSAFQASCDATDVRASLVRLHHLSEVTPGQSYGLTDEQREALVLAYENGYYRSPSEVSLADLASEVGITGQSFGSRLRRGTHRLVEHTLVDGPDET
ncbi:DNA-binding protein [Halorubellus sp. JP-L1]|uniref:helix-turn-helix domain-containing protein n=1 Tax=Halorubellus sp. JP-L1 TaxID=2715753 RepID=UPI0014084522|nr:DNA-binding protein [Halorubellus sp. JP-L1]